MIGNSVDNSSINKPMNLSINRQSIDQTGVILGFNSSCVLARWVGMIKKEGHFGVTDTSTRQTFGPPNCAYVPLSESSPAQCQTRLINMPK